MVNRLYDIISNRLSHDFKLHIGLLEADIQRKDINKYIEYKTSDDVKDDNISWFN